MSQVNRIHADPLLRRSREWFSSVEAYLPAWLLDLVVAASMMLAAIVARILIEGLVGGIVPFALTFPAVLAATLLAGARAGAFAAVGCQLLTVEYVFPNWLEGPATDRAAVANLALTTGSLAVIVWAASSYRMLSRQLRSQCQREVETLSLFIREMDHRTKNNFQIAAHLLAEQARGAAPGVADEFAKASARLHSIASVYRNLLIVGARSESLDLGAYLGEVIALLRDGIVPPGVALSLSSDEVRLPSHAAMIVGLLVNEWIVNAVKYAFPEGGGLVAVSVKKHGRALVVTVTDDGQGGFGGSAGAGSRLMQGLAATIRGSLDFEREGGTTCILRIADADLTSGS